MLLESLSLHLGSGIENVRRGGAQHEILKMNLHMIDVMHEMRGSPAGQDRGLHPFRHSSHAQVVYQLMTG